MPAAVLHFCCLYATISSIVAYSNGQPASSRDYNDQQANILPSPAIDSYGSQRYGKNANNGQQVDGQQMNYQHESKTTAKNYIQTSSPYTMTWNNSHNIDTAAESDVPAITTTIASTRSFARTIKPTSPQIIPTFFCSHSNHNYDCKIQNVKLRIGEKAKLGTNQPGLQKSITFEHSWMEYLPKTLIDAFPKMELLNLMNLKIENIENSAFSNAHKLNKLFMDLNRISEISSNTFLGASSLETLVLAHNNITNVDNFVFNTNKQLTYLYLEANKISKLPSLSNNRQLEVFNASHNQLDSIDDDQFKSNGKLKNIDLSFNQLSYFNLDKLNSHVNLDFVDLKHNNLTELHIPTHLKKLNAYKNAIQRLSTNDQGCYLEDLNLAFNKITEPPNLYLCNSLQKLDLSHNLLEEFYLLNNNMPKLIDLNLANNHLFEIKISNFPAIQVLDLSHNHLSFWSRIKPTPSLHTLQLQNNNFIKLDFNLFNNLKNVSLARNEWECTSINHVLDKATDRHNTNCLNDFQNINGICCKYYTKPYNDRFNKIIFEGFLHEFQNKERQREICPTQQIPQHDFGQNEEHRQAAATADSASRDLMNNITAVENDIRKLKDISIKSLDNYQKFNETKKKLFKEIERQRVIYGVEKEGLINGKEMLERVVKFVKERDEFNHGLLEKRKTELNESKRLFADLNIEKTKLEEMKNNLIENISQIKSLEKNLKIEKDKMEKVANRNAASIHGATGIVTK